MTQLLGAAGIKLRAKQKMILGGVGGKEIQGWWVGIDEKKQKSTLGVPTHYFGITRTLLH